MQPCDFLVSQRDVDEIFFFLFIDGPDDFSRHAHDDHAIGDDHSRRHDRACSDEAALADFRMTQQLGADADEGTVAYGFAVNHGPVANGDERADDVGELVIAVDDDIVLHVGAVADGDGGDVAADHDAVPDDDIFPERDFAKNPRGVGDVHLMFV